MAGERLPGGRGKAADLPQGVDGPVSKKSGVPGAAVPEEKPAGQGLDALLSGRGDERILAA